MDTDEMRWTVIGRAVSDENGTSLTVKTVFDQEPAAFDLDDLRQGMTRTFVASFGARPTRVAAATFPYIHDEDGDDD